MPPGGLDAMSVSSDGRQSPSDAFEEQEGGESNLFSLRRRRAFDGGVAAEAQAADVFLRYCASQGLEPACARPGTLCTTQKELEELRAQPPYATREELEELNTELSTPKG